MSDSFSAVGSFGKFCLVKVRVKTWDMELVERAGAGERRARAVGGGRGEFMGGSLVATTRVIGVNV